MRTRETLITEALVRKLALVDQDIWDTRCRGLVLRGRSSGRHSYRFQVRRGRWIAIGATDDFKPDKARAEAEKLRGDIAHGKDPHAERRAANAASLSLFLEKDYGPWVKANRQTGAETLRRLAATFGEFDPLPLKDITLARVERWRTGRLLAGIKPSTVNRDLASLRSVLSRAVEFGVLREHPLSKLKASRVDERGVVRFLTPDEEKQLRTALAARDDKRRVARESANEWRTVRGYDLLPVFGTYTDHVTPLVLLALNTGLRRIVAAIAATH